MEVNNYQKKKIVVNADIFNNFEREKFSTSKRSRSNSLTIDGNRSDDATEESLLVPQLESQSIKKLINRRKTVDSSGIPSQRGITKKDLRITYKMTPKFKESRDIIFAEKRRYVHKINKVQLKEEPVVVKSNKTGTPKSVKPNKTVPIKRKITHEHKPKISKINHVVHQPTNADKNENDNKNDNKDKINQVVTDKNVSSPGELPKQLKIVNETTTPTNKLYYVKNAAGKKVPLLLKTKTVLLKSTPELTKMLVQNDSNASSDNYCKIVDEMQASECGEKLALDEFLGNKSEASTDTSDLVKTVKIMKKSPGKNSELMTLNYVQKKSVVNLKQPYVMKKMHFVADACTQTPIKRSTICRDIGVQTDYIPQILRKTEVAQAEPMSNFETEHLPNIEELVAYLLENETNSEDVNVFRNQLLMDMSKKIQNKIMKDNEVSNEAFNLKRSLFNDLKDCVIPNFMGNMPIHTAVINGDLSILRRQCFALKVRKITVDILNNQGQTPLQLAITEDQDQQIVTTLLSHGANVNILDENGNSLFHLTVMYSSTETLKKLSHYYTNLTKGINAKNDDGMTALMLACTESKFELLECLLEHGADPNIRDDKSGRTALFHAIELDLGDVIHILLGYKADPKVRNFLGQSCIDAARDLNSNVEFFENPVNNLNMMINLNSRIDSEISSNSSSSTTHSHMSRIAVTSMPQPPPPKFINNKVKSPALQTVPTLVKVSRKRPQNGTPKTPTKKKK